MELCERIAESIWTSCLNEDIGSAELYISHLNEKALFGSMSSSMKKWVKQISKLKVEIAAFDGLPATPKAVQAAIDEWKKSADALMAKINNPDFQNAMKAVDDNTGWFGRDKGHFGKNSGLTSTKINKDNDLVEESYIDELTRIREAEKQNYADVVKAQIGEMANSAKDFTEKTKLLATAGVQMPGAGFKKFLKKAGPVLTMGSAVVMIAATALTGGGAAPVLMGVATGMKTVGLGLTAGRSFAGASRAFARGENGKGALKTGLGVASAVGAGMGLHHGIGQVQNLSQRAQDVTNWDPSAATDVVSAPDVPQAEVPNSDIVQANAEDVKAAMPEVQKALPNSTPEVQTDVADYVAKNDGMIETTPNGQTQITYEDGTAEIVKQTSSGETIVVDADTGNPVESVSPSPETAAAAKEEAAQTVVDNVGTGSIEDKIAKISANSLKTTELTSYKYNGLSVGRCTCYDMNSGLRVVVPEGSSNAIVSLSPEYAYRTADGAMVPLTDAIKQEMRQDFIDRSFGDGGQAKYLGWESFPVNVVDITNL